MTKIQCGQPIRYIGFPPGSSGCLVSFTNHLDQVLLLTAGHAVVPSTAKQFDPIEAPDLQGLPLGRLLSWTSLEGDTTTDAALVWVDTACVSPTIQGLGVPKGINRTPAAGAVIRIFALAPNMAPREGQITKIGADIPINVQGPDWRETLTYRNQVLSTGFTDPADIGAVAFDAEDHVVGIVAATGTAADGNPVTVITPIAAVLEHPDWHGLTLQLVTDIPGTAVPPSAISPPHLPAAAIGSPATAKDVLARTLWAEDRSAEREGMTAVAAVILNRLRAGQPTRFGRTVEEVCKMPAQFSCWNPSNDPNHVAMLNVAEADAGFRLAREIADDAIAGRISDPTGGARHYVSLALFNRDCTGGSQTKTFYCRTQPSDRQIIRDQIFFRNVA